MIESCIKNDFNLLLIKGINNFGKVIVLFTFISISKNYAIAFEKYKIAGFRTPKFVIVDSKTNVKDAFMSKFDIPASNF